MKLLRQLATLVFAFVNSIQGRTQIWSSIPGFDPTNQVTIDFMVDGNELLVVGGTCFDEFPNMVCYPMMKWDSLSFWFPLPATNSGFFYDRAVFNTDTIYAGSVLWYLDEPDFRLILKKENENWSILGNGICSNGIVYDIELYQQNLIICGSIDDVDCDEETYWMKMAAWTGTEWQTMGGVWGDSNPRAMAVYDDKLYVVGDFESVSYDNTFENSLNVQNIAWYDGTTWGEPMDGLSENRALAQVVDSVSNKLYVGGSFTEAGDTPVSRVAAWDGEQWYAVGAELEGEVMSLCFYRGQLYAGGSNIMNGQSLAYFDGYHWQEVPDANIYNWVEALGVYKNELYIGGTFDYAGGIEVPGLVRYFLHPDSVVWGVPDNLPELENHGISLSLSAHGWLEISANGNQLPAGELNLYEALGRCVHSENTPGSVESIKVNISKYDAGIYLVSFRNRNGKIWATKFDLE